jgi:hypothetical protein
MSEPQTPDPTIAEATERLKAMQAIGEEFVALIKKLDAIQTSGPPDASDGSHVLGKLTLFTSGNGCGSVNPDGTISVPMGLVGLAQLHTFNLNMREARQLALAFLNAGA